MVEFKKVTERDVVTLCANAREADINEVLAITTKGFRVALEQSISESIDSFSVHCDGDLLCICGFSSLSVLSGHNVPWMLGTKHIRKHPKEFYIASKTVINWMKSQSSKLENYVHCEHKEAIRWLSRLGFSFDKPAKIGINDAEFMRFYLCVL